MANQGWTHSIIVRMTLLLSLMLSPTTHAAIKKSIQDFIAQWPRTHTTINLAPQKHYGLAISRKKFLNRQAMDQIIIQAKKHHINTFVVEFLHYNHRYQKEVGYLKAQHISFVPRIEMFYPGGHKKQMRNPKIWQSKWPIVKQAILAGADAIQLDYIRYHSTTPPKQQNIQDVKTILTWYQQKIHAYHKPLQIVVFGITAFKPSLIIGQDVNAFASIVDILCPTLYPSHFEPFRIHATNPTPIIASALHKLHKQLTTPQKPLIIPYIEVTNYRYRHTHAQTIQYIQEQIRAINNGGTDGWYFWSSRSRYQLLFEALDTMPAKHRQLNALNR
jgi:hypothetical protein